MVTQELTSDITMKSHGACCLIMTCMLLVDDIISVDNTRKGIISKVEREREVPESNAFRIGTNENRKH